MKPTREQVMGEPAGRQLDAWVHVHVLGKQAEFGRHSTYDDIPEESLEDYQKQEDWYVIWHEVTPPGTNRRWSLVPRFSTSPAAVWELVEKVGRMVIEDLRHDPLKDGSIWHVWRDLPGGHSSQGVGADSMPLAVCRAALLTVLSTEAP